ncbi:pre-mRNA cleavage and polyadenylation factor (CPF) complex subunit [Marasmius crinis-equi]|uniref:Polyadenylation factor subunit 2 n=1 Tax=Marasmius crinis-equi TaxID=585013 RepID=A0ABR3FYP1_9AGAR
MPKSQSQSQSPSPVPVLLPSSSLPTLSLGSSRQWVPTKHMNPPEPPPSDAPDPNPALLLDGKAIKKTRPRRTVDYNGGLGRWMLLRKMIPSPGYVPYMRPCLPAIIGLLPPKAYPENPSTSLCTKFVHTSTNKIRCPVNIVTWTPEGRRILTGSTSGEFTLWNGLTFNFETILQAHDTAICTFSFTHSGAYLASADKTGIIKYFEPNMNNLTAWQGSSSREAIRGISFSPDDRRFATASDDRTVRIWAFEESRVESVLDGHGWDVKCVQWHPSKGLIVSGSKDNQIKFWDPRSGTILSTLHNHKNTIQALAWSPNGNLVASASRDQTVRVFDIRAMKEYRILKGHKKEVCSVTWHPFHQILVSGGSEGAIIHWDLSTDDSSQPIPLADETTADPDNPASTIPNLSLLATPTPVSGPAATLSQAHDSNVWSLQYHPLGHLLVSASNDHTTRFWSRERPGEGGGGGIGAGGEKPADGEWGGEDEEDMMVPGFGGGGGWKEEDVPASGAFGGPNDSYTTQNEYGRPGGGGFSQPDSGYRGGGGGSGGDEFSIPGFGDGAGGGGGGGGGGQEHDAGRHSNHNDSDEWGRGGGGNYGGSGRGYRDSGHNRDSGYGGGGYGGGGGGGGRSGRWGGRRGNRY